MLPFCLLSIATATATALSEQNERYKMLKDRSNIDEKESRIGLLITNLDEKESKLRQMMGTMKEQQDQWQRSITDLKVCALTLFVL